MARGVTSPVTSSVTSTVTPPVPKANEEATRQIVNIHEVQEVHHENVEITEQDTIARGALLYNNIQQLEHVRPSPQAADQLPTRQKNSLRSCKKLIQA